MEIKSESQFLYPRYDRNLVFLWPCQDTLVIIILDNYSLDNLNISTLLNDCTTYSSYMYQRSN